MNLWIILLFSINTEWLEKREWTFCLTAGFQCGHIKPSARDWIRVYKQSLFSTWMRRQFRELCTFDEGNFDCKSFHMRRYILIAIFQHCDLIHVCYNMTLIINAGFVVLGEAHESVYSLRNFCLVMWKDAGERWPFLTTLICISRFWITVIFIYLWAASFT